MLFILAVGEAFASLFLGAQVFPGQEEEAVQNVHVQIRAGRARATFSALPYGEYALAVLHDEDLDARMASSWLGQPREGFGFWGRPAYNFGPPAFADTAFLLNTANRQLVVWMKYETQHRAKQGKRPKGQRGQP